MKENNFTIEQLEKIIDEAPGGAEFYTPGYAAEYRKITGRNVYYGFVDNEWMEAIDKSLSIERINKGFNLSKLQKQLEEMKMQESTQETRMTVKEFLASGRKFHVCDEVLDVHGDRRAFKNQISVDHWNSSVDRVSDCCLVISAKELQPEFDNTAQQVESLGSAVTMSERDIEDTISDVVDDNCPYLAFRRIANELHNAICAIQNDEGTVSELEGMVIKLWDIKKPSKETNNTEIPNGLEWNSEGLPPVGAECLVRYNFDSKTVTKEGIVLFASKDNAILDINGREVHFKMCDYIYEKPLTPAQKQQKIDEQNGELLFKIMSKLSSDIYGESGGFGDYSSFCQGNQMMYKELAKQVSFKGKLESI